MPDLIFPKDYIEKYDKNDFLKAIKGLPDQLLKGYELSKDIDFHEKTFSNIILLGMGGSSIAGFLLKSYFHDLDIPIIVDRNYHLHHANKSSLVIAVSYSGNTEETVSSYREAIRKGCKVVAMGVGGKLQELSKLNKNKFVKLPGGMQPRQSVGLQFSALLRIMENLGFVKNAKKELQNTSKSLKKDVFTENAIKLSEKLVDKIPIVYSSEIFYPVAYSWKAQGFNENSKVMAVASAFSELNHNENNGFVNSKLQGKFHLIILKSQDDGKRIHKRMSLTRDQAQKFGIDVTEIGIKGNSFLTRLFSGIYLGYLTSFYLAMRYETDPSNIDNIEDFKKKLGPFI